MLCGARLAAKEILYEDQREAVVDQHLVIVLARLTISLAMANCIKQAKVVDQLPEQWFLQGTHSGLVKGANNLYRMRGRLYVLDVVANSRLYDILGETHYLRFMVHPRLVKVYHDLFRSYQYPRLKKDVLNTVSRYLFCQQVKIEHQRLGGLFQPVSLPEWKWNYITCNFAAHLPPS